MPTMVNAPPPPVPFTVYELVTFRRSVLRRLKDARRRAKQNAERRVMFPGRRDADALRVDNLTALDAKVEAWLAAAWPFVDEAGAHGLEDPSDDESERYAAWIAASRLEGARVAQEPSE